jgi:hypothetical protein
VTENCAADGSGSDSRGKPAGAMKAELFFVCAHSRNLAFLPWPTP